MKVIMSSVTMLTAILILQGENVVEE